MTGDILFKKLRRRLEESTDVNDTGANWSADEKKDAFKIALKAVSNTLADNYLSPLYKTITANSSTKSFGISDILTSDSILSVKVTYDSSVSHSAKYAEIINLKERSLRDNYYMQPTTYVPIAYLEDPDNTNGNTKVSIEPSDNISSVEFKVIQEPSDIEDSNTYNYPLGDETINALLYLAEGECWRIDNQPNRAGIATQLGMAELQNLNGKYNPEL